MSASRRMFGSLWNSAAAHEHRRQDGSRRPSTMAKRQTTTGGRVYGRSERRVDRVRVQLKGKRLLHYQQYLILIAQFALLRTTTK